MKHKTDFFRLIDASINELEYEFDEDELAYLAMNGKVEYPVRNKFAYILHKKCNYSAYADKK